MLEYLWLCPILIFKGTKKLIHIAHSAPFCSDFKNIIEVKDLIILGIDPGVATVGYGVLSYEGNRFLTLDYGVVSTKPADLSDRLLLIHEGVTSLIEKYSPEAVAVEELFFNTNAKTALHVGHGRGVILLAARQKNIPIASYTPLQVKQAVVGYGCACTCHLLCAFLSRAFTGIGAEQSYAIKKKGKAMFYYIKGKLFAKEKDFAVLDCCGVGYRVNINIQTSSLLPAVGEEVLLYTHFHLREELAELFGFLTAAELKSFKMLISVSGIGPKAALKILSIMPPEKLAMCIITNDAKAFTVAPGVGLKTAQRLILELKDKMKKEQKEENFAVKTLDFEMGSGLEKFEEARDALTVLGYSTAEAAFALKDRDFEKESLEEIIKESLKMLMK